VTTLKVLGVDCNNCAANVQKALQGVSGIEKLEIKLSEKTALASFAPG